MFMGKLLVFQLMSGKTLLYGNNQIEKLKLYYYEDTFSNQICGIDDGLLHVFWLQA